MFIRWYPFALLLIPLITFLSLIQKQRFALYVLLIGVLSYSYGIALKSFPFLPSGEIGILSGYLFFVFIPSGLFGTFVKMVRGIYEYVQKRRKVE